MTSKLGAQCWLNRLFIGQDGQYLALDPEGAKALRDIADEFLSGKMEQGKNYLLQEIDLSPAAIDCSTPETKGGI